MPKSKEGKFVPTFGTKTNVNKPTSSTLRPQMTTKQKSQASCKSSKQNVKNDHLTENKKFKTENNLKPRNIFGVLEKPSMNNNVIKMKNISKQQNETKSKKVKEHNFDKLFSTASSNAGRESSVNVQNKVNSKLVKNTMHNVPTFQTSINKSNKNATAKKKHNFDELFSSANKNSRSNEPLKQVKNHKFEPSFQHAKNTPSTNTAGRKKHNFDELFSSASGGSKEPAKQMKSHKFDQMFSSARFENEEDDFLPPQERKSTVAKKRKKQTGLVNKKIVKKPNLFDELFSSASKAV